VLISSAVSEQACIACGFKQCLYKFILSLKQIVIIFNISMN
jgi:hypothetical protein